MGNVGKEQNVMTLGKWSFENFAFDDFDARSLGFRG